MPFWRTPAKQIRNHFKRRFDPLEAPVDEGDRMLLWNQRSPWANIPPDILYYICDQAFSETSAHYGVEMLALVCKHWHQIVTGYGRPWSVIRITPYSCRPTVYTTLESYVSTRLKYSHHYPLDVTIHPVSLGRIGSPNFLRRDIKNAIDAVIGDGLHTRRWGTLNAIVHPYLRAQLKYPTPILHRVELEVVNQYGCDLSGLFPVAPKLQVLSVRGGNDIYYLHLSASTSVTLDNLHLEGFSIYICVSVLKRFSKTRRLTTLELTGTWSDNPQEPPATLPTVRSLTLNAWGPVCVMFSAITLPTLVELIVIGCQYDHERNNALDDRDAFKYVGSTLETLRLESLHFDNEDHLESILLAAPKVKRLTMKGITYEAYEDLSLEDSTSEDPTWTFGKVGEWITAWEASGESGELDYVTLLKGPLVFPVLEECIVDDINREDLVLLRRQREVG